MAVHDRQTRPRVGDSPRRRGHAPQGFTLIELLVVIAILSLLVSILMPALKTAQSLARTTVCATNVHNMGRASFMYAADYENYVPRDFYPSPDDSSGGRISYGHYFFAWCFAPYLGGPDMPRSYQKESKTEDLYNALGEMSGLRCPSVKDDAYVLTYVANGMDYDWYTQTGTYDSSAASRIDRLPGSPSELAYISELSLHLAGPRDFRYYDFFMPDYFTFWDETPNLWSRTIRFDDTRHDDRTPMAHFDGHVTIRVLCPEDFPNRLLNPLAK